MCVVAVGLGANVESEGRDREKAGLALPGHQNDLVKDAIAAAHAEPINTADPKSWQLRYVDRGLGLFPDGDGMYLQLSYLVSLGALELVPGGEGTPPRLCGDPEVVLAGFRSLARVLADTLLAGDVERSLALYRDFGPAGQARHLAPLVAHLSTRPGASLEYLQEPAGAVSSAVALAS